MIETRQSILKLLKTPRWQLICSTCENVLGVYKKIDFQVTSQMCLK
jgi:hypothetical protein